MGGLGLIAAALLLERNLGLVPESRHRKQDSLIYFGLSFIVGLIFANIFNWFLYEPPPRPLSPAESVKFYGLTFYWGLVAFLLATVFLLKMTKYPVNLYLNALIPSVTIFHAFGRIGCSFAGCCFGTPIDSTILYLPIFPAREIEAVFLFVLTGLLSKWLKHDRLMYYLLSYPPLRFVLEFFRGDDRGKLFTNILSPSQLISIALFVVGLYLACRRLPPHKHDENSPVSDF